MRKIVVRLAEESSQFKSGYTATQLKEMFLRILRKAADGKMTVKDAQREIKKMFTAHSKSDSKADIDNVLIQAGKVIIKDQKIKKMIELSDFLKYCANK